MAITLIVSLLVLLAIGVPVGFALWLTGLVAVLVFKLTSLTQIAQSLYSGLDSFVLLAIPFFILAGNIMLRSGFAKYLFDLMQALVGGVAGGASIGASGASAIFGAMTGSSVASAAALGRVMIPEMGALGYPRPFTAGLMAAGGTLGILIPPERGIRDLCRDGAAIGQGSVHRGRGARPCGGNRDRHRRLHDCAAAPIRQIAPSRSRSRRLWSRLRARRAGAADARDRPWRHLSRHLHADGSGRGFGRLRTAGRHVPVPHHFGLQICRASSSTARAPPAQSCSSFPARCSSG